MYGAQWTTGAEKDIQRDSEEFDNAAPTAWVCADCGWTDCECPPLPAMDEAYADAWQAQYDDDPNPYHGDYSEM